MSERQSATSEVLSDIDPHVAAKMRRPAVSLSTKPCWLVAIARPRRVAAFQSRVAVSATMGINLRMHFIPDKPPDKAPGGIQNGSPGMSNACGGARRLCVAARAGTAADNSNIAMLSLLVGVLIAVLRLGHAEGHPQVADALGMAVLQLHPIAVHNGHVDDITVELAHPVVQSIANWRRRAGKRAVRTDAVGTEAALPFARREGFLPIGVAHLCLPEPGRNPAGSWLEDLAELELLDDQCVQPNFGPHELDCVQTEVCN